MDDQQQGLRAPSNGPPTWPVRDSTSPDSAELPSVPPDADIPTAAFPRVRATLPADSDDTAVFERVRDTWGASEPGDELDDDQADYDEATSAEDIDYETDLEESANFFVDDADEDWAGDSDEDWADDSDVEQPPEEEEALSDEDTSAEQPEDWHRRNHHVRNGILIGVLVLVLGLGTFIVVAWAQLNGRLGHGSTAMMLDASDRPTNNSSVSSVHSTGDPFAGKAMNILVLGSDSRGGNNSKLSHDKVVGERSDTTFIAHVSADRTRVDVVSIPRDTWITIPKCVYPDGSSVPGSGATHQKFNAAFAYGSLGSKGNVVSGAACTIKAVEAMSKVRISGYVVIDFSGFDKIINAIGGVDMYLPCAINAPKAGVVLPKGVNHLNGKKALGFARARTGQGLGDGSDLMRIARQQALFEAIANKVLSMNYMTDIKTLYNFAGSIADSVTTDLGNLTGIAGFAYSLRDVKPTAFTYTTIPVGSAGDGSSVVIIPSQANPIWKALANDTPLSKVVGQSTNTPKPGSSASSTGKSSGVPAGMVSAPKQC